MRSIGAWLRPNARYDRWLTFVRRPPHGFSRLGSSLFTSSGATFCGVAISCNAPLPITASPERGSKVSRQHCSAPFLLLASGAGIVLITPWLRLRRRSRLTDQQMQEIAEVEPGLPHRARGWAPTVLRTLTNMTTTPIAEVSDLQDPHAGDPSPAGLADGLWSRGELRGAVAPCSRRAASRVAGRSSGSPQRSAPSSISAASFRPPSSCAGYSRGLTTWRRPGNLPRP